MHRALIIGPIQNDVNLELVAFLVNVAFNTAQNTAITATGAKLKQARQDTIDCGVEGLSRSIRVIGDQSELVRVGEKVSLLTGW